MTDSNDLFSWLWREAPAAAQTPPEAPPRYVTHAPVMGSGKAPTKPLCCAKTRTGLPCKAPGNGRGGRCRRHGGASSGAKTAAGRQKVAAAMRERWADPAFRERQNALRQERWADPAYRLAIATGSAAHQRKQDYQLLRAQPRDIALGDWLADRERVRRARLKALRLQAEVAKTDPR
jgi:hypothetical protein